LGDWRQNLVGDDAGLSAILREAKTIAVLGAKADPWAAAHYVPAYLRDQGYRVVPVNPKLAGRRLFDVIAVPTLADLPAPPDVIEVFRRPEFCDEVAQDAVDIGAKVLWLQLGITCDPARRIATEAGLTYVEDACMGPEHRRLLGAA